MKIVFGLRIRIVFSGNPHQIGRQCTHAAHPELEKPFQRDVFFRILVEFCVILPEKIDQPPELQQPAFGFQRRFDGAAVFRGEFHFPQRFYVGGQNFQQTFRRFRKRTEFFGRSFRGLFLTVHFFSGLVLIAQINLFQFRGHQSKIDVLTDSQPPDDRLDLMTQVFHVFQIRLIFLVEPRSLGPDHVIVVRGKSRADLDEIFEVVPGGGENQARGQQYCHDDPVHNSS